MTSFAEWIVKHARADDSRCGDFILDTRDLIAWGKFPAERITSADALRAFVVLRPWSSWDAAETAVKVWRQYERWTARRAARRATAA